MREKACIVLNERESSKERSAETLARHLEERGITASRLKIDGDIEKRIIERCPQVLIVDYLLGDYSTGVDILIALQSLPEDKRPATIFLTDEPGVSVAVEAMKSGAVDYFELDNPRSLTLVAKRTEELVRANAPRVYLPTLKYTDSLDDLNLTSKVAIKMLKLCKSVVASKQQIVVLCGPDGVGKTHIAYAINNSRKSSLPCKEIHFETDPRDVSSITGLPAGKGARLGRDFSAIFSDLEDHTGELLEHLSSHIKLLALKPVSESELACTTICTENKALADQIVKLLNAQIIDVPSLTERKSDITPLVQRFAQDATANLKKKVKPIESAVIKWLSGQNWPGEVQQLKAVTYRAIFESATSKDDLKTIIEQAYQDSLEDYQAPESTPNNQLAPSPLAAALTFERCEGRYRVAAAQLGCTVPQLRALLTSEEGSNV